MIKGIKSVITGGYNVITKKMSDEAYARYEICKSCDKLIKIGSTQGCSECGCAIPQKCASPEEKCVIGKWK